MQADKPECDDYLLTIVQHTYCGDCMWLKGKITDVYHASGIVRGEDSIYWRVQILSPPWNRELRAREFPKGFATVDVPALKLEVENKIILATQDPGLISELLQRLKWMLINRKTNIEIRRELESTAHGWAGSGEQTACTLA
jgi:hypothetical protein